MKKHTNKKLGFFAALIMAMALVMGMAMPTALAGARIATEGITVSKTGAPDPDTALQWDLTLNVTGSQSSEPKLLDVLLIIDTSGSMDDGGKLEAAQAAACALVDTLSGNPGVNAQFGVAWFSDSGHVSSSNYSADAVTVKGWINGLSQGGRTNIAAGIYAGRSITGVRTEALKYAVLLSDGEPNRFAVSDSNYYTRDWEWDLWPIWGHYEYDLLDTGYGHSYSNSPVFTYNGSDYTDIGEDPDYFFAKLEAGKLKGSGFSVYTVGLDIAGNANAIALLNAISSGGSTMQGDADDLAAIFAAITADIQLAGTNGYVVDQVPAYLDIVPGSFVEYIDSVPTGVAPDVTLSYMGVPNQFRWNLTGGDINTSTKTLTFTVSLNGTYAGGPTASLLLNSSATLNYTDKAQAAQTMPFSPMPTGVVPGIDIDKSANKTTALEGDTITYTFTVTNLTGATLSGVMVTDPMFPSEAQFNIGTLDTFVTFTVDYVVPADATFPIVNTASVAGYWMYPAWTAGDSDGATVDVTPVTGLSITKSADKTAAYVGETVHYTLHIANTGNQPLTGIAIQDLNNFGYALLPVYPTTLAAGGSFDVEYDLVMVDDDPSGAYVFSNTASVWCDQVTGPEQSSWDVNVSPVPVYGVTIDKSVTTETTEAGLVATFTIKVKNIGDQPLAAVLVKDDALGFSQTVALAVGEERIWVLPPVTYTEDGTYTNTATAEDPGEEDLFAKATDGVSFTYIPEEEPPEDNPDTGYGNGALIVMGIAIAVMAGLFAIEIRQRRTPAKARRNR